DESMNNEQQILNRGALQPTLGQIARSACIAVALFAVATGCASYRLDRLITDDVEVERMDSRKALIRTVQLRDHDGRLKVSGRLKKRHRGRSRISGHLHIEALGQDGNMLRQVTTGYRRLNSKTGTSEFSRVLDIRAEQVRTVRVIHHHRDDDENATNASQQPGAGSGTFGSIQTV
ncbi:MAG: hypothetical protein WBG92_05755, partial [Thiohalocapsa sp.]